MTEHLSESQEQKAAPAAAATDSATPSTPGSETSATVTAAADPSATPAAALGHAAEAAGAETPDSGGAETADAPGRARRRRRGGKKRNAPEGGDTSVLGPQADKPQQSTSTFSVHPLLVQLAQWHPALFGEQLLPFKRGIYEDLLAAHPFLDKEALKLALQQHTRSTRYLSAMASGHARHDLNGQSVEATLPEHVHHALIEVFRRRQRRSTEDLQPKLRRRIVMAFQASGLSRDDYAQRVLGRDEAINALVTEALAEGDALIARDEALLRSFELSGATSEQAFAEMYGMDPRQVAQQLERARRRQPAA